MKIILSKQCESLTGMLNSSLGYHIEHRKNGFFSKRNQRGIVPPDGHWRFILTCAELAQNKLHIADIRVSREELKQAMYEARIFIAMQHLRKDLYDARDILNLKITFSL
jgi:hypothetical protein